MLFRSKQAKKIIPTLVDIKNPLISGERDVKQEYDDVISEDQEEITQFLSDEELKKKWQEKGWKYRVENSKLILGKVHEYKDLGLSDEKNEYFYSLSHNAGFIGDINEKQTREWKEKGFDGVIDNTHIAKLSGLEGEKTWVAVFNPNQIYTLGSKLDIEKLNSIKESIKLKTESIKNQEFDFSYFYIPMVIFVITATSNAVNLTDGLDGLAIGTVGIVVLTLGAICYVTGNIELSNYLNIIYLRGSGELIIFCAALVGAALGFLWFNSYPAQVFMGDTGSLALGGAIGALTIMVKKELILPILGGIFFIETVSVILQRTYFKYTKKKYGEGKRLFRMAPIHHHFELMGIPEPKIVTRFYIIAILLMIISLATFKVR